MTTVLKLGGSVITRKEQPETLDRAALTTAAAAIGDADTERLVVVHGGGSFGHPHAETHGVSTTTGTDDAAAVTAIHGAMGELNAAVVAAMQAERIPAVPIRPLSAAVVSGDGNHTSTESPGEDPDRSGQRASRVRLATDPIRSLLGDGFVPMLHGDVVATSGEGCTILSGDTLVAVLADRLSAERVGLCTTVPGVFDTDGAVLEEITARDAVEDALGGAETTDVTGGMATKVDRLLGLEAPASVFGLDALPTFLETGTAGTVVR